MKETKLDESLAIPDDLDFRSVPSLSNECREKFNRHRPSTVSSRGAVCKIFHFFYLICFDWRILRCATNVFSFVEKGTVPSFVFV